MRAWKLDDFGFDNLHLYDDVPVPVPGPGEILVKVAAAALNYRDKALVEGIYAPEKMPKGLIPVADFAGSVAALGEGVTKFAVGDRVTSHFYLDWIDGPWRESYTDRQTGGPLDGGLAEYAVLTEAAAMSTPAHLSDEGAATLPIAALTPWFAMREYGDIGIGDTVLVQGTGGVSVFATQIATALGARVIGTSSSDDKLKRIRELGATDTINYRTTPDWAAAALELTGGEGVDMVIDVVGGTGLTDSVRAVKGSGMVAVVGFLDGQTSPLDLMSVIWRQARVQGIAVGHVRAFERLLRFVGEHRIRPVVDSVFDLEDAREAYERLNQGPFGKVVIKIA
ncbi:zinc-dependent alcohol dehydrogenase family protein [Actinoplanes derwentensis]|uniref:NADPH:quinone reductase n=1 Tax=Actinoplanes derwentensis TaxID=113562 RepID=A0A1H1ST43_9ACTN|nr:NAD(P)-dependent alcohol dehydrogenase [Actinoplanes derwentensis]GID83229.1 alcohol dehydrogenase [Actinoplanes derwentensis]SDS50569.1 NADPH:quinone reductase [Actinoplanes derwentensis]